MSKKIWLTTGIVVAAIGVSAIVAHAQRGGDYGPGYGGRGGYDRGGYDRDGYGRGGDDRGSYGRRDGRWSYYGRDMTKADFDDDTRARFAEWDANADGAITRDEVESGINRRMERRWNRRGNRRVERLMRRFDTDNDGKVTKAEIEAYVTKQFQRMDIDGDGKITDADLPPMMRGLNILAGGQQFKGYHRGYGRNRGGGHRMIRFLAGADTNNDGAVSLQEMQDRAAKRMARLDRNKDGMIDKADREALRKEIVTYRVMRFLHRFGATKDGKVSLEQFTKVRNERFAERQRMRGGWGYGRRRYDDRDGDRGAPRAPSGSGSGQSSPQ